MYLLISANRKLACQPGAQRRQQNRTCSELSARLGFRLVSLTAGDSGSALQPAGWALVCLFAGRDAGPHTPEAARRTGGPRQGTASLLCCLMVSKIINHVGCSAGHQWSNVALECQPG